MGVYCETRIHGEKGISMVERLVRLAEARSHVLRLLARRYQFPVDKRNLKSIARLSRLLASIDSEIASLG